MAEHSQQTLVRNTIKRMGLLDKPGFPPFQEFVNNWFPRNALNKLIDAAEHGVEDPSFVAMAQAFHVTFLIAKAHDPIFEISSDLIHALRDTKVPDVPTEEIKLPFEGINIDFPKGTLESPGQDVSRLMLASIPGDRFRVAYHHGERTTFVNFIPKAGKTLHQCTNDADDWRWKEIANPEAIQRFREEDTYGDYWKTDMFRLAINTVLYITSPESDVVEDKARQHKIHQKLQGMKGGQKRTVLLRKLAQTKQTKRYIVGAKFRLSKEYSAKLTASGKTWVLEHRVRTMGHWRNQPYGPKMAQCKRIWIAPFWRGPAFVELMEKGYVVK